MKKTIIAALLAITAATAPAQVNRTQALINAALKGWDIELRMGYNLGGTSPIPLPEEIRKIDSYSPGLPLSFEANFIKRFDADRQEMGPAFRGESGDKSDGDKSHSEKLRHGDNRR